MFLTATQIVLGAALVMIAGTGKPSSRLHFRIINLLSAIPGSLCATSAVVATEDYDPAVMISIVLTLLVAHLLSKSKRNALRECFHRRAHK